MKFEIRLQSELSDYRDNPVFAFIIGAAIEARQEEINSQMAMWFIVVLALQNSYLGRAMRPYYNY